MQNEIKCSKWKKIFHYFIFALYQCSGSSGKTYGIVFTVDSDSLKITQTYIYNFDSIKPHFYTVKLGFSGVYIIFLISAQIHRLWVLVRTASTRRFFIWNFQFFFLVVKFSIYLNRRVFVMDTDDFDYCLTHLRRDDSSTATLYTGPFIAKHTPIQIYRKIHLQKLKFFK